MATKTERSEAMAFMVELMEMGVEYPDAEYQTAISYDVDPEILRTDYDELCVRGAMCYE